MHPSDDSYRCTNETAGPGGVSRRKRRHPPTLRGLVATLLLPIALVGGVTVTLWVHEALQSTDPAISVVGGGLLLAAMALRSRPRRRFTIRRWFGGRAPRLDQDRSPDEA